MSEEPDNIEAIALLSRVYRLRGGATHAADYFKTACDKLTALAGSQDWSDKLTLAILYTAGDARFWDDKESYQKQGKTLALEVINQIEAIRAGLGSDVDRESLMRLFRAEAVALIILENFAEAQAFLSACQTEAPAAETKEIAKKYVELYSLAASGKWLWPLSPKSAMSEFLMYYCYDSGRFIKWEEVN